MLTPAKDLVKRLEYREALPGDLAWINEQYEVLNFKPSTLENDEILLAVSMGRPVGVGRLTPMENSTCELGGIFVLETFRRLGVGRKIVDLLMERALKKYETLYCIPLPHLVDFYKSYGFDAYEGSIDVLPEALRVKYGLCQASHKVKLLLWLRNRN